MEIGDGFIVGVYVEAPLREGRPFPVPLWLEEDDPAPLPGTPPERHGID